MQDHFSDPGIYIRSMATRGSLGGLSRTPIASGILTFRLLDFPSMLASFEVTNTLSPITKLRTLSAFVKFCYGEIRETYLPGPFYSTRYENLVLRGKIHSKEGGYRNFFFPAG